jgi:hypothetical protein
MSRGFFGMDKVLNKSLFAQVTGELIFDTKLSHAAYRFYNKILYLSGANGHCWHSQAELAEIMECSTRSIRNWRKECEEAGILLVKHRFQKTNLYYPLVTVIPQKREVIHDESPAPQGRQMVSDPVRQQTSKKSHAPNNNQNNRAYRPLNVRKEPPNGPINFADYEPGGKNFKFTQPIGS